LDDLRPDYTTDRDNSPYDQCPDCLIEEQTIIRLEPEELISCWYVWDRENKEAVNDVKHEDLKIRLMKTNKIIRATDYTKWADINLDTLNNDDGNEFDEWLTHIHHGRTVTWITSYDITMFEQAGYRLGSYQGQRGNTITIVDEYGDMNLLAALRMELEEMEVTLSTGEVVRVSTDDRSAMTQLADGLRR